MPHEALLARPVPSTLANPKDRESPLADFARDASYSMSPSYSPPNASGVQRMFLVRVLIGEYCRGKRDQPVPDVRSGSELYDATVDSMANPSIFVTYHDAQAYPEYVIAFSQ